MTPKPLANLLPTHMSRMTVRNAVDSRSESHMSKKQFIAACVTVLLVGTVATVFQTWSSSPAIANSSLPTEESAPDVVVGDQAHLQNGKINSVTPHERPSRLSQTSGSAEVRFSRARICHEASSNIKSWELQLKVCKEATDDDFVKRCSANVVGLDDKVQAARRTLAQCSPVPAEIEENFYRNSIEAAKAGDATAQLCYLESNFDLKRGFTQDEVAYYHSVDADYVNAAINRGDWRIATLLSRSYGGAARHPTMRGELTGGDPVMLYQMNRLLSLGASGAYRDYVSNRADEAKAELTPEQVEKADAWVAVAYERHFAASPRLTEAPTVCESRK